MKKLPYLPKDREILYISEDNKFIQEAKLAAKTLSFDKGHPAGVVIVKDDIIIGRGGNGSFFHHYLKCLRKIIKAPTGEMYWLCPGCQPRHHAESSALKNIKKHNPKGADLYMWGHWWCCQPCWDKMIKAGIKNVYLPENAENLFKKKLSKIF